ncbi:hypothetical protein PQQ73_27395 [Paraburkholderia strydomiana]|uniref:Uncharacterized protein n=1 Tax=Paraburkholderia strydomiana TaxID=1245417 RepID=A0ABW9ELR6_9BURK
MLRSTVLVGLLMLPGAFLIVGLACIHPRLRKEIVRQSGLSSPLTKTVHFYTALDKTAAPGMSTREAGIRLTRIDRTVREYGRTFLVA